MKSFKKVAVTILAAVMMLAMSSTVFAANSPVKTSFNASLTKKTVTYNGKKQAPKVTVTNAAGKKINSKYYTVKTNKTCKDAGKYTVTITGKGKYAGYKKTLTYKIKAKTNKVTLVSRDTYTVKAKSVKKANKTCKQAIKLTKKVGTVSYKTDSTNIKVNKNGKIVIAKGTPKGIYQVVATVKAKNHKTVNKYIKVVVK